MIGKLVTREIKMTGRLLDLARRNTDAFGIRLEDGVIAVVRDGATWRAVEQFGHRTDEQQERAAIYLPMEIQKSLDEHGGLIPARYCSP